jgi:hypothetical protein
MFFMCSLQLTRKIIAQFGEKYADNLARAAQGYPSLIFRRFEWELLRTLAATGGGVPVSAKTTPRDLVGWFRTDTRVGRKEGEDTRPLENNDHDVGEGH